MTITLPDEIRDELERKAKTAGFTTVAEYVAELIHSDEMPDVPSSRLAPRDRAELEAMLDEGMASGDVVEADDAFWAERRRLLETHARKTGTTP